MLTSNNRIEWTPFRCEVQPERGVVRVTPHGELDVATVPEVERHLRELRDSGFDHVLLDLRELEFMDSTGVRLLLREDKAARGDGRTFSLVAGARSVQRVLELSGVMEMLDFRPA